MASLAQRVHALACYAQAAECQLRKLGWYSFGAHADRPDIELEFSDELDSDGCPWFERVAQRGDSQS